MFKHKLKSASIDFWLRYTFFVAINQGTGSNQHHNNDKETVTHLKSAGISNQKYIKKGYCSRKEVFHHSF
jgi:hypothetical protein